MEKGEEVGHIIQVLEDAKKALIAEDPLQLKELSNQVVHSLSIYQSEGLIAISVILYALSKLIERKEHLTLKDWGIFVQRTNASFEKAAQALKEGSQKEFEDNLISIRNSIEKITIKPFVQEVLKKAEINKASRLYEHGISMAQAASLLGISQWELMNYIGKTTIVDMFKEPVNINSRIKFVRTLFS
jgi:hypothetical protein